MKMKNYISLFLLIFLFFSACDTNSIIEVELPDHQPVFTVIGSLEAGIPVDLIISKSNGILEGNDFPSVKDADVTIIEEGGKSYPLYFFEREYMGRDAGGYTSDELEIKAGHTYHLIVSGENMPTAYSTVTLPRPLEIKSYTRGVEEIMYQNMTPMVEFSIELDDPEDLNFYEISVFGLITNRWQEEDREYKVWIMPNNPAYTQETGFVQQPNIRTSDVNFNGNVVTIKFLALINLSSISSSNEGFYLQLKHISEDYYKYEKTAALQRASRKDPLAQTVQVHSNIKNGLGTLKAGTATRMRVE